jgi:aminoglycoside N3'-acetyltransferase
MLLLGVGHDADTTIHLAEALAGVRPSSPPEPDPREIDHCCARFNLMDPWLDAEHRQRRGTIGGGDARLVRSRHVVDVAIKHLREDENVFLHPRGIDAECDAARASISDR